MQDSTIPYYDVHTHNPVESDAVVSIHNIIWQQDMQRFSGTERMYSLGMHPWYLQKDWEGQLLSMEHKVHEHSVKAIGEIGLDRACHSDWSLQTEVFLAQLEIAERLGKPVIIHSVRSYFDMIEIKKTFKPLVPWILHGYNGNLQTTKQLVRHGFLFSLGANLLNSTNLQSLLKMIPLPSLLLETDESRESIVHIYKKTAQINNLDPEQLKKIIHSTFIRLFP